MMSDEAAQTVPHGAGPTKEELLDEFASFYFRAKGRGGNPTLRAALMGAFEKKLPQVRQALGMSDEELQFDLQRRLEVLSLRPL